MPSSLIPKNLVLRGILLTIFLLAGAITFSHYLLSDFGLASRLFMSRILFWLVFGIMFAYAKFVEHQPFLIWKESKHGIVFYLASVIGLFICTLIGSVLIVVILKNLGLGDHSAIIKQLISLGIPIKLFVVLTAAVTEEFIVRGYLMPRIQLFFKSTVWPIVISSILFGLAHIGFGTIVNVAVPLIIGLVFAIYYQKYRNIKALIICHFMIDFFSLIIHH